MHSVAPLASVRRLYHKHDLRRTAAREVLSTEVVYVKGLRALTHTFVSGVKRQKLLSADEVRTVQCNAGDLLALHEKLLATLQHKVSKWHVHSTIGDVFLERVRARRAPILRHRHPNSFSSHAPLLPTSSVAPSLCPPPSHSRTWRTCTAHMCRATTTRSNW